MRRLFWRIYAAYLVVVLLCTLSVGALAVRSARGFFLDQTEQELEARAGLVREEIWSSGDGRTRGDAEDDALQVLVGRLGEASSTRITVVAGDWTGASAGTVLADSQASPAAMENHADRPEVRAALAGDVGQAVRRSETVGTEEMYVAVPVAEGDRVVAVVRTAVPLTSVDEALESLVGSIFLAAAVVALVAAAIGVVLTRRISRPMRDVCDGAARLAAGDFGRRLQVPRTEEFAAVAESLNRMADDLDDKIRTITRERNEREAVLASMVEGVLAVDPESRVIAVNRAAADLLDLDPAAAHGRAIEEVVRSPQVQRVVAEALDGLAPVEADLASRVGHRERFLQANGARLHAEDGSVVGAVVVLNDVTRLRRLEAVRRDFVANVSHELKTPVTSIKGFAETLLDGALDDPEAAARFVRIIAGQADRLNSIISDLLALSSLEEHGRDEEIVHEDVALGDILRVARDVCAEKAAARGIDVRVDCAPEVTAMVNPPLLEQALVNLIDNAVKYAPEGSHVTVSGTLGDDEVVLAVRDEGPAIAREHLPRLFERFYRVDKARSRDMGGTGLGLAIVKHIAQVHGGRVSVDSVVGRGSTFRVHLPRS